MMAHAFLREAHALRCARREVRIVQLAVGDACVSVCERRGDSIASMVWPASQALCEYLGRPGSTTLAGRRVVELGAGTGAVSAWCAVRGAHVVGTDLPHALALLECTAAANRSAIAAAGGAMAVCALDWASPVDVARIGASDGAVSGAQLVLCADVVYDARLAAPLCDVLHRFAASGADILLAYTRRSHEDDEFFARCAERGLAVELVTCASGQHAAGQHGAADAAKHHHILRVRCAAVRGDGDEAPAAGDGA